MDFASLEEKILKFAKAAKFKEPKTVHGPYVNSRNREFVVLVYPDGSKKTKTYARYIMEKHLNRELDPDKETVDHKDYDRKNNDISNLELIPRKEHSKLDTRRVKPVKCVCKNCGKKFERSPRVIRDQSTKGKSGPFCSRKCAAIYGRAVSLGKIDKLPAQTPVKSEYYRLKIENRKKKKAQIENLLIKIAEFSIKSY